MRSEITEAISRVRVWRIGLLLVATAIYGAVFFLILRKRSGYPYEVWYQFGDSYGLLGLLCVWPLCVLAIPYPLTGGALLCGSSILFACGYALLPGMIGPFAWGFLNAPAFGLGALVIFLRLSELGYTRELFMRQLKRWSLKQK